MSLSLSQWNANDSPEAGGPQEEPECWARKPSCRKECAWPEEGQAGSNSSLFSSSSEDTEHHRRSHRSRARTGIKTLPHFPTWVILLPQLPLSIHQSLITIEGRGGKMWGKVQMVCQRGSVLSSVWLGLSREDTQWVEGVVVSWEIRGWAAHAEVSSLFWYSNLQLWSHPAPCLWTEINSKEEHWKTPLTWCFFNPFCGYREQWRSYRSGKGWTLSHVTSSCVTLLNQKLIFSSAK